jgi:hypothetical protein
MTIDGFERPGRLHQTGVALNPAFKTGADCFQLNEADAADTHSRSMPEDSRRSSGVDQARHRANYPRKPATTFGQYSLFAEHDGE